MPDAAELLAALRSRASPAPSERNDAIACYLSASDGWRDALRLLGGAFAPAAKQDAGEGAKAKGGESGLKAPKDA